MALARWNGVVQDAEGNAVSGAQIEVRNEATGGLVPLYADRDGTVGLGNPYVAVGPDIAFHVRGGNYRITASKGSELKTWRWEAVGTTQAVDIDDLIVGLQAGIITAQTVAELDANAPETPDPGITPAPRGGVVWNDPNPALNGYYTYNYAETEWEYARPLPDTFAKVLLSGSGVAQTGVLAAGVSPAGIEVFFAKVFLPNTGPLTLSINGGPARPVVNLAGNPLAAGEWTGMVMFYLDDDGQYQLLIDAGAAASAAQSATEADAAADRAEAAAVGVEGGLVPEVISSGAYTVVAADANTKLKVFTNDTAVALTIPTNANVAFQVGWMVTFEQRGDGIVSIAGDEGVTVSAVAGQTLQSAGPGSIFQALKVGADDWIVFGSLLSDLPGFMPGSVRVFTTTGTWTRPAGCRAVIVEVIGGGGGGRGPAAANSGGGGGGGGYSKKLITTPGATEAVTVGNGGAAGAAGGNNGGAGGTSAFGTHCSATGGAAGANTGGNGGQGAGGDINARGCPGFNRTYDGSSHIPGNGGGSLLGGGGNAPTGASAGAAGSLGGGGSGGRDNSAGGAGGAGIVIVTELY